MQLFHNLSIRHKLQGIVIVACGVALVVASAAFTIYDRTKFLRSKTDDLIASAKMIGSNSTAALTFHDSKSAQEILSACRLNAMSSMPAFTILKAKPLSYTVAALPNRVFVLHPCKLMEARSTQETWSCSRA